MSSTIQKLLESQPTVRLIFHNQNAYIDSQEQLISVYSPSTEEETIHLLNQEFKVYFAVAASTCCKHVFTVRSK